MKTKPDLYLMAGPTAAGKSAAAIELAHKVNGVIINADALQIYADLPILSAQPSESACKQAEHRLYGVLDALESGSAARWVAMARAEIAKTVENGQVPLLVGGTGLYFRALLQGLSEIPNISNEIKEKIKVDLESGGLAAIRERLATLDPDSYSRLKPKDTQRLLRAYEVVLATGKPLGWWHDKDSHQPDSGEKKWARQFTLKPILMMPERAELYARCDRRFLAMIEQGAVAEVQTLLNRKLDTSLPIMKTIGVREIGSYLSGEITLDAAITAAQQSTRNYAKRQMTWFRNQSIG